MVAVNTILGVVMLNGMVAETHVVEWFSYVEWYAALLWLEIPVFSTPKL